FPPPNSVHEHPNLEQSYQEQHRISQPVVQTEQVGEWRSEHRRERKVNTRKGKCIFTFSNLPGISATYSSCSVAVAEVVDGQQPMAPSRAGSCFFTPCANEWRLVLVYNVA